MVNPFSGGLPVRSGDEPVDVEERIDQVGAPVVVGTHPRSGTHLTIDLLRKQFIECQAWLWFGETLHHLYLNLDRLSKDDSVAISLDRAVGLLQRAPRPLVKTHSRPRLELFEGPGKRLVEALLERGTILYVVRDGREVMCSAHIWRQEYHPEARCPLSEFMRQREDGVSRVKQWARHVESWSARDDVHIIRFKEIVSDPRSTISELGRMLGLHPLYDQPYLPSRNTHGSRWADYWRRLTRQFESTAIPGRYNGQKPADWKEAFTAEDRRFFHEEAGQTLMRLEYEEDDGWAYA